MIRSLLAVGVSALSLALAAPAAAQQSAAAPAAAPTPLPPLDFGAWGVGLSALDPAVDPGDDFFAYVNGKWVRENPIPADRTTFGTFAILAEQSIANVEAMMSELSAADPAPGTQARRVVDAYRAFHDERAIEAAGLAPAYPYLTEIYAAPDLARLVELFGTPGYPALVAAGVSVDDAQPDRYLVSIGFDGMGMPDRDYYLVDSPRNLEIRAAYRVFLVTMLREAGYADPVAAAEAVYAFEHRVAELEWDRRVLRIPELRFNPMNRAELLALSGDFPLARLLETMQFAGQDRFDAGQIPPTEEEIAALGLSEEQVAMIGGGLPAMMRLLDETPLATIKAWMAVRFLNAHASVLPARIDDASFAFYGTVLGGQQSKQPRWKRAIAAVEGQLGEQVGALYVARHFPPEAKSEMEELVANLKVAMRQNLEANDWMGEATRAEALNKLAGFTSMIGYPDEFETYEGLEIRADDPLGNRVRAIAWNQADDRSRLNGPVDRTEWGMLPQTVNAYYAPNFNQIVFPAAILQPPFFNLSADPAINYGAIGAVIGHEIGHGFDDQGSRFDASGALRNWWQDADRAAFSERTARLKTLIEQYCPVDEGQLCLRGEQAMGETIGDVVGLQMAWRAYQLSLGGREAPVIDGLTGAQRFFLGYAQVWRDVYRPEALRNRVLTANHPPATFRLNNTVRQMDAFYEAFDVGPDDALWLPPEQRVRIW